MKLFNLFHLSSSQVAAAKTAGIAIVAAAGSGLANAVTVAAQAGNPIGAAALASATAVEQPGKTGAEKKAAVVAAIVPVIAQEAAKGGFTALEQDAEQFAGLIVEEVVASMKRTPVVQIGDALLHALGID